MNNIIQQFYEDVINLEEKSLTDLNNINFLSDFTDALNDNLMQLGKKLVLEYIKNLEENIYLSDERKEKYSVYQKNSASNNRKIITIFGEIEFSRRYYIDNERKKTYLLDKLIGLSEKERILKNVEESMLNIATFTSYEKAGKNCAYGEILSKETVKNKIEELDFSNIKIDVEEDKNKLSYLYIQADEDHVSLQDGGIAMPRLITVYEGNCQGVLKGKRKFGGIYDGDIDSLWEEVTTYITNRYNDLKRIYIMGDGANWIKKGLEWIPNSIYVADRFHIDKAINKLCVKNEEQKLKIRSAMFEFDFEKVKELSNEIIAEEMDKKVRQRKVSLRDYILNNEEGFKNSIKYDVPGCAAEGDISHTFSARMSSRPLGWKRENVDKMSKLRVLSANGINIKVVTRNENNKQMQEKIEEQKRVNKYVSKSRYKRENGISFEVPMVKYGNFEMRLKLKELLDCKAI